MSTTQTKPGTSPVVRLTETAVMLALATVLSVFKLLELPYGGSITFAAMLPMLIIAYRYGMKWGFGSAAVYGLLQMLLGVKNFTYVPGVKAVLVIFLFDYFLAFAMMGFGGLFRRSVRQQGTALALGALVACAARYACHVISGFTVWAAVPFVVNGAGLAYSLVYNAGYMLPETIVTVIAAYVLGNLLDFRQADVVRLAKEEAARSDLSVLLSGIAKAAVGVAAAYDIMEVVGGMMSDDGFSVAALQEAAPWGGMLLVSGICVVIALVAGLIATKAQENTANLQSVFRALPFVGAALVLAGAAYVVVGLLGAELTAYALIKLVVTVLAAAAVVALVIWRDRRKYAAAA